MSPARQREAARAKSRRVAFAVGVVGFVLMAVAVRLLALSNASAFAFGWMLVAFGVGAALWAVRELWETSPLSARHQR